MFLLLFSCSTNQTAKQIAGLWVIDEVVVENHSYPKGLGFLLLNVLRFDENNRCEMPQKLWTNHDLPAEWEIFEKKDGYYVRVVNCEEESYNSDFKIIFNSKNKHQISLVSDKITFTCSKVSILGKY